MNVTKFKQLSGFKQISRSEMKKILGGDDNYPLCSICIDNPLWESIDAYSNHPCIPWNCDDEVPDPPIDEG